MLNQLPGISAPHPPHILKTFVPLLPGYGDLRQPEHLRLLVSDVCRWVNANPVSWAPYVAEPGTVLNTMTSEGIVGIFAAISQGKALSDGADTWCCKSMESVAFTELIESAGLQPIYIYLFRDGRDVALSFMKAIVGPKHIYSLATKWAEEQRLALRLKNQVPDERFISIRYEDLITNPEAELRRLCSGLRVEFSASMLDYSGSDESRRTADAGKMWENLNKPVLKDNTRKFMSGLSEKQLLIFEQIAGDVLKDLGYDGVTDADHGMEFTAEERAGFLTAENELQRQARTDADPRDLERRRPQELILKEILERKPFQS